jgi:hypothetical protein
LKKKGGITVGKKESNTEIDFSELERLSKCGGSDQGEIEPQSISAVVSATLKICLPAVSSVTALFSCNRTCGCK